MIFKRHPQLKVMENWTSNLVSNWKNSEQNWRTSEKSYIEKARMTQFLGVLKIKLEWEYSQTWANDHLRIATTCLQRPPLWSPNLSLYNINLPLNNGHKFGDSWVVVVHEFDCSFVQILTIFEKCLRYLKNCCAGSRDPHCDSRMWNPLIFIGKVLVEDAILGLAVSIVTPDNCWNTLKKFHLSTTE